MRLHQRQWDRIRKNTHPVGRAYPNAGLAKVWFERPDWVPMAGIT
jgi:hypothetical protein